MFTAFTTVWNGIMCVFDSSQYGWLSDLLPPLLWLGVVAGCVEWQRRKMISESKDRALIVAVTTRIFLVVGAVIGFGFVFRLLTIALPDPTVDGIFKSFMSIGLSQSWAEVAVIACAWTCGSLVGWFVLGRPVWRRFNASSDSNSTPDAT